MPDYGNRPDGTAKGNGWYGPMPTNDGRVATELTIGVNLGGKETNIPLIVPTLSQEEINHLMAGGKPTQEMVSKAAQFAQERMAEGKSPYADNQESQAAAAAQGVSEEQALMEAFRGR